MPKLKKKKSITRMDYPDQHLIGWNVRVYFRGVTHRKMFADKNYGGKIKAYRAAVEYRDKLEKRLGKIRSERTIRPQEPGTGIRFVIKDGWPVFEVFWNPSPGVLKRTSVSIEKHGYDAALERAIEIREEKYQESL
jgi:hypothetical protein